MDTLATGAAALGLPLSTEQLAAFGRYRDELVDWNTRINLTSAAALAEVETRHFLDSLTCVTPLLARWGPAVWCYRCAASTWGAGAGSPACRCG